MAKDDKGDINELFSKSKDDKKENKTDDSSNKGRKLTILNVIEVTVDDNNISGIKMKPGKVSGVLKVFKAFAIAAATATTLFMTLSHGLVGPLIGIVPTVYAAKKVISEYEEGSDDLKKGKK